MNTRITDWGACAERMPAKPEEDEDSEYEYEDEEDEREQFFKILY